MEIIYDEFCLIDIEIINYYYYLFYYHHKCYSKLIIIIIIYHTILYEVITFILLVTIRIPDAPAYFIIYAERDHPNLYAEGDV